MKVVWFVNVAMLLAFLKIFEIPSMIPVFVDELHITYAQAGLFMTVYSIVRCIASSPAGSISDKWGAIQIVSICLLLVGVAGLVGTIVQSYELMLVSRTLVSIGVAIIFIASVDAVPKYLSADQIGKGIGYINGSLNIGIAVALFLTPMLVDSLGWRWTARIYSLSFLLLFVVSLPLWKTSASTTTGNSSSEENSPPGFFHLVKSPAVLLLSASAFVLFIELYGVLTWIPAFLGDVYKFSPGQIGSTATMFGVAAIPASILTGFLCTSLGRITMLCISGGLMAGLGILALLITSEMPFWLTFCVITLISWGHTQVIVTIMSITSLIVPPHSSGKTLGIVFTFAYRGSIIPSYLGGYLLTQTGTYNSSFIIFAIAAILSIAGMLAVTRILRSNPPSHFTLQKSN